MNRALQHTLIITSLFATISHAENKTHQTIAYTFLKDCTENINNNNTAYSELTCPDIGPYKLSITQQSPQYFNIIIKKGATVISSDFTTVTNELPIEAGKAIEWHLVNGEPKQMIFRLAWGTEDKPFDTVQYLTVNNIYESGICTVGTVNVQKNKQANEKARELLKSLDEPNCTGLVTNY